MHSRRADGRSMVSVEAGLDRFDLFVGQSEAPLVVGVTKVPEVGQLG